MAQKLIRTTCFCGRPTGENNEDKEDSIYCSTACARLDSMSALCAQESIEVSNANRMKQVFRFGRKEAFAKSSHYRRMERTGKPSTSGQAPNAIINAKAGPPVSPAKAVSRFGRLHQQPKGLRPLLLGSAGLPGSWAPPPNAVPKTQPTSASSTSASRPQPAAEVVEDADDDASVYGDDDEDEIFAPARPGTNLCSHFSDSSAGSRRAAASLFGTITPSSSAGSLASVSLSTSSTLSSISSQDQDGELSDAALEPRQPTGVFRMQGTRAVAGGLGIMDMETPRLSHEKPLLDVHLSGEGWGWRFDTSGSALDSFLHDY